MDKTKDVLIEEAEYVAEMMRSEGWFVYREAINDSISDEVERLLYSDAGQNEITKGKIHGLRTAINLAKYLVEQGKK